MCRCEGIIRKFLFSNKCHNMSIGFLCYCTRTKKVMCRCEGIIRKFLFSNKCHNMSTGFLVMNVGMRAIKLNEVCTTIQLVIV